MNQKRIFSLLLMLGSIITGFTQNPSIEASTQSIKELKQGVLVVIIPSYHQKIKALEELVNDPKTKTSVKNRNKKLIESTRVDQQKTAQEIQKDFTENYNFSELAFIYDTTTVHLLKNGIKKGVFLKDEQQIDLTDKSVFFLRYGHTDRTTTTGRAGWIVTDNQLQDLQKPFPYYVTVFQPLKMILRSFFTASQNIDITKSGNEKDGIGLVINEKFWTYYDLYQ